MLGMPLAVTTVKEEGAFGRVCAVSSQAVETFSGVFSHGWVFSFVMVLATYGAVTVWGAAYGGRVAPSLAYGASRQSETVVDRLYSLSQLATYIGFVAEDLLHGGGTTGIEEVYKHLDIH